LIWQGASKGFYIQNATSNHLLVLKNGSALKADSSKSCEMDLNLLVTTG